MDKLDFWVVVLQIVGILLIVVSGVLLYRTSIRDAERRRDVGMTDQVLARGRVAAGLLRAKTVEGVGEDKLLPLQVLALSLLARRPFVLFAGAFPVAQLGSVFLSSAWWHKALGVLLAVYYWASAVQTERSARAAAAFLERYPVKNPQLL